MRLTNRQQLDLDTSIYYIPSNYEHLPITGEDIARFFAYSDRGIGKDEVTREAMQTNTGLAALYWGKQRRDLQVTSYLEDWGQYITSVDFATEEPEFICRWLSKVMKKPGIYTMWKLINNPDDLDKQDGELLKPLAVFI